MPLGSSAGVGAGVDLKNEEEVKEYIKNLGLEYRFSCYQEKIPKGCHLLASYWEAVSQDFSKAKKTFEVNCDVYDYGPSCDKAGMYHLMGKTSREDLETGYTYKKTEADPDKGYDYLKKACELGFFKSCLATGLLDTSNSEKIYARKKPADPIHGLECFRKACDDGKIAEGCSRYASYHIEGGTKGYVEPNKEIAFEYAKKACELGSLAGCINLAVMYKKGDGVEKNLETAKAYEAVVREMQKQLSGDFDPIKFAESPDGQDF